MTDIPDYYSRVPNTDIHTMPAGRGAAAGTPAMQMLWDRLRAQMPQIIRWLFAQVGISFGGVDTAGWDPLEWLSDWAQGNANALGLPASSSLALPQDWPAQWKSLMQSMVPPDTVFAGSSVQGNALSQAVSQAFSGNDALLTTAVADAKLMMSDLRDQVLLLTRQLQDVQADATSTRYAGQTWKVNFGDYPDGALPALFTVSYFGSGTSTVGVRSGRAVWNLVNDGNRGANVIYNTPTDTDRQVVRATMGSAPDDPGTGGTPRIWCIIRADSDTNPQTFVWVRAYSVGLFTYKADIGYTITGVEHVWQSGIALTWSLDIEVVAGVGVDDRMFEVYSGDTLVKRFTDTSAVSAMGATQRFWGSRTEMKTGLFGALTSGSIAATSATDNLPPDVIVPIASMYRTSTSTVSFPNSWTTLPNNFFQVVAYQGEDITASLTNGSFTVGRTRSYRVSVQIRLGTAMSALPKLGLLVNGSLTQVWVPVAQPSAQAGLALSASWTEYLQAGDVVQVQTWHSGITGNYIQAEATGMETWFNIAGMASSYA